MRLKDAVLKSLKEINKPVTYRTVYLHILENKYYDFSNTNTPENSVSGALTKFVQVGDFRVKRIYHGKNEHLYQYIGS